MVALGQGGEDGVRVVRVAVVVDRLGSHALILLDSLGGSLDGVCPDMPVRLGVHAAVQVKRGRYISRYEIGLFVGPGTSTGPGR
ncbi:hypothetical protein Pmi06nite_73020 [Planotetraspora mira]|uniref:Uncharacterized protein n=1 Tax=Planotetraspora mira TaxID=58121 RepID=A0A8J3XAC4_9ACTN|nr:hypothetical protein Pmi06nite_73020 [Planotetraspora mira]